MRFLLVALLLAGCGGGGGSDNLPTPLAQPTQPTHLLPTAHITDFIPVLDGSSGKAVAVREADRVMYWFYTWEPGRQHAYGEAGAENNHIATCENGERWQWLDGYSSGPPGSLVGSQWPTWPVGVYKATWTNLDTGVVRDITKLCGGLPYGGQPYLPYDLPQTGRYQIDVWGPIYQGPPPAPVDRHYYWRAQFTFGKTEFNPCWQGAPPSTRPIYEQLEAYLDGNATWIRGRTLRDPWNGETPADPGPASYTARHSIATGAGILWSMTDEDGTKVCLQSATLR